jgi:hypothetical protein
MGTTTFSGPIKAGTIKDTTGTTVGADVTTVNNDSGTATVQIGTSGDGNAFIPATNVKALGTTRGTLDTEATDVGTSDLEVLADFVAGTEDGSTGAATATVLYIQNNNLS